MTDADDKLSRRYREVSREEPPAHLDAAILAASRRAVGTGPGARKPGWMVPASIAAVLVLGIGVSLRMQLEQPGIETSAPAASAEYPVPAAADSAPATPVAEPNLRAPAPAPAPATPAAPPARAEPEAKRRAQAEARRETQADAKPDAPAASRAIAPPVQQAPAGASAESALRKDAAPPESPGAAAPSSATTSAAAAPSPSIGAAPQAARRAKIEGYAADATQERAPRPALGATANPDPVLELERIAKLRENAHHAEADRALEAFRRRHPDYRIPEAVWDRVKPR
jgi:hypothetical protein